MTKEKFIETYCSACGSQQCAGPHDEFSEGCSHYRREFPMYYDTFVNLRDAGDCVIDLVVADTTKKVVEKENDDFYRGAMWGMSWAISNIFSKCPRYVIKEN